MGVKLITGIKSKPNVRFLARLFENDLRTVHGKNLSEIALICGEPIEFLTSSKVKGTYVALQEFTCYWIMAAWNMQGVDVS